MYCVIRDQSIATDAGKVGEVMIDDFDGGHNALNLGHDRRRAIRIFAKRDVFPHDKSKL
jgi:hypothetical protein